METEKERYPQADQVILYWLRDQTCISYVPADGFLSLRPWDAQDTYKKILRFLLLNKKYNWGQENSAKSLVIVLGAIRGQLNWFLSQARI